MASFIILGVESRIEVAVVLSFTNLAKPKLGFVSKLLIQPRRG